MRRDMRGEAAYCSLGGSSETKAVAPRTRGSRAMATTAQWLVRLGTDSQRARNLTMPSHADSPIVLYTLVYLASALFKWTCWETTPTMQLAPHLTCLPGC